jgi:ergothioneine biosynthesis protein EgtB
MIKHTDVVLEKHTDLIHQFNKTRKHTESLCEPLQVEDYVPQSAVFASPTKWHLAHTTWFFEEMILKAYSNNYQVFDSQFGYLFNSYYNTIGERTSRAERGLITRPGVKEVYAYRAYVDEEINRLFQNTMNNEVLLLLELGLNHEQQHQELLITDLKYSLSRNPIYPVYSENAFVKTYNEIDHKWIKIEEGIYEIGHKGGAFAFDNELQSHKVFIHEFEIDSGLVTNREYVTFIESGGYESFEYWLDEAWSEVLEQSIAHPLYWKKVENNWYEYTLAGLKPLDLDAQLCHINFFEAAAFAEWKGLRLPTEFEWEVASDHLKWGTRWEWTNSAYLPYPGFKKSEGAVGEYNGKFMINQMVLRGGSSATAEGHSRKTYRNFFHPNLRWQFSGIRLVK